MRSASEPTAITLKRLGLEPNRYVLVVPNDGADPSNAPRIMAEAAARVAGRGYRTVFVGNTAAASGWNEFLQQVPRLGKAELMAFIRGARLVISNDTAMVVQALICHRPCVATAMEDDGISHLAARPVGGIAAAHLDPAAVENAALSLLDDGAREQSTAYRPHHETGFQRERAT